MKISVTRLTPPDLARRACQFTTHAHAASSITMERLYAMEHSPIRTQLFAVEMVGIPNFVSVHFVRHHVGVDHYVQTMREDRGAAAIADRLTPTNHLMIANALALINMARKRLCHKASFETREVMAKISTAIGGIDPALGNVMVPECQYRGVICHERTPCGQLPNVKHYMEIIREGEPS